MEHLTFVVIVLEEGKRLYGYMFNKDYESEVKTSFRFLEHKYIHDYREKNNLERIVRINKSEIIYIDNNLRF